MTFVFSRIGTLLALAAIALVATPVHAQTPARTFPVKPVRILVGYAAGGLPDTVARIVAQRLGDKWGQQVLVDNRPSSNGILAGELLAKAAPDGYMLLCTDSSTTAVNPVLFPKLPYDADRDFAAVSLVARAGSDNALDILYTITFGGPAPREKRSAGPK